MTKQKTTIQLEAGITLSRADAIEQLTLSLGAYPLTNFNLAAMAEKLANELGQASKNRGKI